MYESHFSVSLLGILFDNTANNKLAELQNWTLSYEWYNLNAQVIEQIPMRIRKAFIKNLFTHIYTKL